MTGYEMVQKVVHQLKVDGEEITSTRILFEITKLSEAELLNLIVDINRQD